MERLLFNQPDLKLERKRLPLTSYSRSLLVFSCTGVDRFSTARGEQKLTQLFQQQKESAASKPQTSFVNHRGHNLTREVRGNNLRNKIPAQNIPYPVRYFSDDFQSDTSGTQPLSSTTALWLDLQVASPAGRFILIALTSSHFPARRSSGKLLRTNFLFQILFLTD